MEKQLVVTNAFLNFSKALYLIGFILLGSCTVTNNFYANDPVPLEKGNYNGYAGIGMGLIPDIESVADNGEVFSNSFNETVNLCVGAKYGVSERFSLGANFHFPQIIGGFGLNIQPQYSFFRKESIFNMAITANPGVTFSTDSIKILGELDLETKYILSADIALPLSIKLGEGYRVIITPRYSLNSFALRKEYGSDNYKKKAAKFPVISLGFKLKRMMFESSMLYWNNEPMYVLGFCYFFAENKASQINPISPQ